MRQNWGGVLFFWRNFVCGAMVIALPASLVADDTGAAMLRHQGGVLLNGKAAPASSAVFRDDTVETQPHYEASIDTTGSTATIKEETLIQYGDNELFLQHGTVLVSTARGMTVRVGCLTVIPASAEWTQYDVTDVDGKVIVNAHKNDVYVERRRTSSQQIRQPGTSDRTPVREGEQATRDERCGVPEKPPSHFDAKGALLNSPWVKWPAAVGIIGGVACVVFCLDDDPISPSNP